MSLQEQRLKNEHITFTINRNLDKQYYIKRYDIIIGIVEVDGIRFSQDSQLTADELIYIANEAKEIQSVWIK